MYYKVLKNGKSFHGGTHDWPLPTADAPGEWVKFDGEIVPCQSGLHVTTEPSGWMDVDADVYEAEIRGDCLPCDTPDKFVCREVRLTKKLNADELVPLNIYSSGEHVVSARRAFAFGVAKIVLRDSSRAVLWDSSRAVLRGSSRASLKNQSTAIQWGAGVTTELFDRAVVIDRSKGDPIVRLAERM